MVTPEYSVCCIREINPPESVKGYPYRDVVLHYEPSLGYLDFPKHRNKISKTGDPTAPFHREIMGDDADKAELIGIVKNIIIFLIRDASPETPDSETPLTLQGSHYVRVLMDEILHSRYCHCPIYDSVKQLFFTREGDTSMYDIAPTSAMNGYVPTKLALVSVREGDRDGYLRLPLVGYHGTNELYVPSIIKDGLRRTTDKGLYGNNAYYFGNYWKAVHYAFRDSQYATLGETQALRSSKTPIGSLIVPNTLHIEGDEYVDDLIRDSPSVIRYIIFPKHTSEFPVGKPSNMEKVDNKYDPKYRTDFITYDTVAGSVDSSVDVDVLAEVVSQEPLFKEDEVRSVLSAVNSTVLPVTVPTDSVSRAAGILKAYMKTHVSTVPSRDRTVGKTVIVIRTPNTLPDLGSYFLMTSGFLTGDRDGIQGASITYINDENIGKMTNEMWDITHRKDNEETLKDKIRITQDDKLLMSSYYKILVNDLVRCVPLDGNLLIESSTLPVEIITNIIELCRMVGRELYIYSVKPNETLLNSNNSDACQYSIDDYRSLVRNQELLIKSVGRDGFTGEIQYIPPERQFMNGVVILKTTDGKRMSCSLRMEPGVYTTRSKQRIMYDKSIHNEGYSQEYENGGSFRVYDIVKNPKKTGYNEQVKELLVRLDADGWSPEGGGDKDTLIIEPFSFDYMKRDRRGKEVINRSALTQHTEMVVKHEAGEGQRFMPLSWHRGDFRTIARHHHPRDVSIKIL